MIRQWAVPILAVIVVTAFAAQADAAWNPDLTSYKSSISTVRTNMAVFWGPGAQASTMPMRAQKNLRRADDRFARALRVLGTTPGYKEICKSLKALAKGMAYMETAGKKAYYVSAYATFLTNATTGAGPTLYGHSASLALSASNYVNLNHSSSRSTRKLLRSGGRTTKARTLSRRTPPKCARGIAKNRKAIMILGRSRLL
jgi:hypothetical protein